MCVCVIYWLRSRGTYFYKQMCHPLWGFASLCPWGKTAHTQQSGCSGHSKLQQINHLNVAVVWWSHTHNILVWSSVLKLLSNFCFKPVLMYGCQPTYTHTRMLLMNGFVVPWRVDEWDHKRTNKVSQRIICNQTGWNSFCGCFLLLLFFSSSLQTGNRQTFPGFCELLMI